MNSFSYVYDKELDFKEAQYKYSVFTLCDVVRHLFPYVFDKDVTVEPHRKQLHVSLAYQFPTDKKERLEALAKTTNLKAPVRWDLRLYSRDRGKTNCQVRLGSNSCSCAVSTFNWFYL